MSTMDINGFTMLAVAVVCLIVGYMIRQPKHIVSVETETETVVEKKEIISKVTSNKVAYEVVCLIHQGFTPLVVIRNDKKEIHYLRPVEYVDGHWQAEVCVVLPNGRTKQLPQRWAVHGTGDYAWVRTHGGTRLYPMAGELTTGSRKAIQARIEFGWHHDAPQQQHVTVDQSYRRSEPDINIF